MNSSIHLISIYMFFINPSTPPPPPCPPPSPPPLLPFPPPSYHHNHLFYHHHQPDYKNHLHVVSGPTKSSYSRREKVRARETIIPTITTTWYTTITKKEKVGFFLRSGSTAFASRPSPHRVLKSNLIRAGDIELNFGPKQPCGKCGKTCTVKALRCTMCGLVTTIAAAYRGRVVKCRETDNYQCQRRRPQNPTHLCTKCGRSFRI